MPDDRILLEKYAKTRNADAFAVLASRYAGFVYATAFRVTRNVEDAEDVTQDCFLELARKADVLLPSLSGWLHGVATNTALKVLRSRRTQKRFREVEMNNGEQENEARWKEIEPHIDGAISQLPDTEREVVVLYYLKRCKQEDIAELLSISQATVSRRIESGLEKLRTVLKKSGIVCTTIILATLLSERTVIAAPEALVKSLMKIGVSGIGPTSSGEILSQSSSSTTQMAGALKAKLLGLSAAVLAVALIFMQFIQPTDSKVVSITTKQPVTTDKTPITETVIEQEEPGQWIATRELIAQPRPASYKKFGQETWSESISRDLRHYAYFRYNSFSGEFETFVNHEVVYSTPVPGQVILLSPHGKRWALETLGDSTGLILDGEIIGLHESAPFLDTDEVIDYMSGGFRRLYSGSMVFSNDGKHFAYNYLSEDQLCSVVDGKLSFSCPLDTALAGTPSFSPDGSRVALRLCVRQGGIWDKACFVIDGKRGREYDSADEDTFVFSSDGKRYAYRAVQKGKKFYIIDGIEHRQFGDCAVGEFSFSPDGRHYVYAVKRQDKAFLIVDGKQRNVGDYTDILDPKFINDTDRLMFRAMHGEKLLVVYDGEESDWFDRIDEIALSDNGEHIAFCAMRDDQSFIITDGYKSTNYDEAAFPTYSPNGENFACVVRMGLGYSVMLNAEELGVHFPPRSGAFESRWFANRPGSLFSVNFHGVGRPVFSPDSRHLAYVAYENDEMFVVLNGVRREEFDEILDARVVFDSSRSFHYLARLGSEIYLVKEEFVSYGQTFSQLLSKVPANNPERRE